MPRRRHAAPPDGALPPLPPVSDGLERASDAPQTCIEWLLPGALPAGMLTLVEGRKGTGKSSVAAAVVASLTGGPTIYGWCGPRSGVVCWIGPEDSWEQVVVPRLDAAGADLRAVCRPKPVVIDNRPRRMVLPDDLELLRAELISSHVSLLILDPFFGLTAPGLDCSKPQQARVYMQSVVDLCFKAQCTAILTRHIRKGSGGDVREQGLGSVEIANVAHSILRCDEHPHERGTYVLSTVACKYTARAAGLAYRVRCMPSGHPRIEWTGISDIDAEAAAEGRGGEGERGEWQDADRLLWALLHAGPVSVGAIQHEADQAGISPRILRRAKERLGVGSRRIGRFQEGHWEWTPPPNGFPMALEEANRANGESACVGGAMGPLPTPPPQKRRKSAKAPRRPAPTHTPDPAPQPAPEGQEDSNGSSD